MATNRVMNDGIFKSLDCYHSPNIHVHNMS